MQYTLKRVLAASVTTLVIGLSSVYGATTEIGNTNAVVGEENVELPITIMIDENEVVSEFSVRVDYETSQLSFDGEDSSLSASVAGNKLFSNLQEVINGKISVSVALDPSGPWGAKFPEGTTTVATLVFDVKADAAVGSTDVVYGNLSKPVGMTGFPGEVAVLGVNPVVTDATVELPEDAIDSAPVHTVDATDAQDNIKATGGYSITGGNTGGAFAIDDAGLITVADAAQLDFETTPTYNLTVQVSDDDGNTGEGTITVNLTDVNEAPTAVADSANATEDGAPVDVDVLDNDTDPDAGDTKMVVSVDTTATVGTATVQGAGADNRVQYAVGTAFQDLAAGETTTDTFDYTMEDSGGLQSSATVTVTVTGVNDAPTAQDVASAADRELVINGQPDNTIDLTEFADDVDSDNAPDSLVYVVDDTGLPAGITASIANGILTIDASAQTAEVPFKITYQVKDSHGAQSAAKTVYLSAINNQPPTLSELSPVEDPTIDEGDSLDFAITASDAGNQPQDDGIANIVWFVNTNNQGFEQVQDAGISSATGPASDQYTFASDQDTQLHDGSNTFVVRAEVTDGQGVTNRQDWTVTVEDVNNPPSIDSVTIQAKDDADDVTLSKPEEITKLVGTASISDLDAEDFEVGQPMGDDEVVFTWMLTRKGVNDDAAFEVASTTITSGAVPDPFVDVLDEAALNTALAGQGTEENGFQKDDQFVLIVAADDGVVDAPVEEEEKATLGNPGWFPAISWAGAEGVNDYKVEVLTAAPAGEASRQEVEEMHVVTMYTTEPKVRVADYFAGQWNDEYLAGRPAGVDTVYGLRPGQYLFNVYAFDEDAQAFPADPDVAVNQDVEVSDYAPPTAAEVIEGAARSASRAEPDPAESVEPVATFTVSSTAGYSIAVYREGGDGAEDVELTQFARQRLFRPAGDTVSTDRDVDIRLPLPEGDTYRVELTPFNPADIGSTVSADEIDGNVEAEQEIDDNSTLPGTLGMSPGSADRDDATYLGKGTVSVTFEWNPVQGADDYRVIAYNAAGDVVPTAASVSTGGATELTAEITGQYTGIYRWYVIASSAGNNGNNWTKWSDPLFFEVAPAADEETAQDIAIPDPVVTEPAGGGTKITWTFADEVTLYALAGSPVDGETIGGHDGTTEQATTANDFTMDLSGTSADDGIVVGLSLDGDFWTSWYVYEDDNGDLDVIPLD